METLEVTSSAFSNGGMIPTKHTCDGKDISPPLAWSKLPAGTKSLTIIADDPDAPSRTWVHWVIYNIPPTLQSVPEAVPQKDTVLGGAKQGITDFRTIGYGGPCPPGGTHRYFFRVYALDKEVTLPPGSKKDDVLKAMEGHILAQGELMGKYSRSR